MKVGFEKLKIIAINPDEEELLIKFPEYEEENFNYSYVDKVNNTADIFIYFQDGDNNIYQHIINIEKTLHITKKGHSFYVNQVADYQIVQNESQLFESFLTFQKGKNWNDVKRKFDEYELLGEKRFSIAYKGEIELMQLIRSVRDENYYSLQTNYFIDIDKILRGDFSEIREKLKNNFPFSAVGLMYIDENIEKIHRKFLPYGMYRDLINGEISNSYKRCNKDFLQSLPVVSSEKFYILEKSKTFSTSMLPKEKILIHDEPEY